MFDAAPELYPARVLLIECSFVLPEDVERAREYAHIHVADLVARADLFENEAIVLTHFSQRYRPEEIREALAGLPGRASRKSDRVPAGVAGDRLARANMSAAA